MTAAEHLPVQPIVRPASTTDPVERIVSIDVTYLVTAALGVRETASDRE